MSRMGVIGSFLGVVLLLLGGGYMAVPIVADKVAHYALSEIGYPDASLNVERIGLTRIHVSDVSLGTGVGASADHVILDYSPGRLANGIIDGIRVVAPQLRIALDAGGLDLGPFQPLIGGSAASSADKLIRLIGPFRTDDATIEIVSPVGVVTATATAEAVFTDGIGTQAETSFSLTHPDAVLEGFLSLIIGDDGNGRVRLDIAESESTALLSYAQLSGSLELSGAFPSDVSGEGAFTLQDAIFDGTALGTLDVAGRVTGSTALIDILMAGDALGLAVDANVRMADIFDPRAMVSVGGNLATDGLRGALGKVSPIDAIGAIDFTFRGARTDIQSWVTALANGQLRADGPVAGWAELSSLGLRANDATTEARLDGLVNWSFGSNGWEVRPTGEFSIAVTREGVETGRQMLAALSPLDGVAMLRGGADPGGAILSASSFDLLIDDQIHFAGDAGGNIWFQEALRFEAFQIRLTPLAMKLTDYDIVLDAATFQLDGPPTELRIGSLVEARFSGEHDDGIALLGGRVQADGDVFLTPQNIRFRAHACASGQVDQLRLRDLAFRPGPLKLCPLPNEAPLIDISLGPDGPSIMTLNAVVPSLEIDTLAIGEVTLGGNTPRLSGSASYDFSRGTWWANSAVDGGRMHVSGGTLGNRDIGIVGMSARVQIDGSDHVLGASLDLSEVRIFDRATNGVFGPLSLSGTSKYGSGTVTFDGRASVENGPTVDIEMRHRDQNNRGYVGATMREWIASENSADVRDILPFLKPWATDIRGGIAGDVRFDWSRRGMTSSARLRVRDLDFAMEDLIAEGVSGDLVLADVLALESQGPQTLTARNIDPGIPLVGGKMTYSLPGDGTLLISDLEWPLAGGRLRMGETVVPFDKPPSKIIGRIDDLDGRTLARVLDIDGFDADGTLGGVVPITFDMDGPAIDNATLRSTRSGWLRYRATNAAEALAQSGDSGELLARALDNFRYTSLSVTLNGPFSGELSATAELDGANPELYDGQPIELNVTLTGALRELLQSASVISNLPEAVRDRIQRGQGARN